MIGIDKNYYEVLEVLPDIEQQDVHSAYIQAKNAYSMDSIALYSLMTEDECEKMVGMIEEAYTILSDPEKRRQYDEARGINKRPDVAMPRIPSISRDILKAAKDEAPSGRTSNKNIRKIVANKRYALDFDPDPDFEKEIEQTTVFTGKFLKRVREYKKVDLSRMSEMTKISKTYVTNIENEDMSTLPALVYVRGFVFQYAKCLKLNPDIVATSYLDHLRKTYDLK